jgi:hypothetical protein
MRFFFIAQFLFCDALTRLRDGVARRDRECFA